MLKKSKISTTRLIKRRDSWMKKLSELGPFTRGSLVSAKRGNHIARQLTVSVEGKTHTVYIPKEMVEEVEQWIKNYRRLQRIIKEVSKLDMAIIHNKIPESRAAVRRKDLGHPNR